MAADPRNIIDNAIRRLEEDGARMARAEGYKRLRQRFDGGHATPMRDIRAIPLTEGPDGIFRPEAKRDA